MEPLTSKTHSGEQEYAQRRQRRAHIYVSTSTTELFCGPFARQHTTIGFPSPIKKAEGYGSRREQSLYSSRIFHKILGSRRGPDRASREFISADSLGKWIDDWTVYHHGSPTAPTAHLASELWLLLNKLTSKLKNAEHTMPSVWKREKQEMVEDFIENGERLWDKFRNVLKECKRYMLRVTKQSDTGIMAKKQGAEFVHTIFGDDVSCAHPSSKLTTEPV